MAIRDRWLLGFSWLNVFYMEAFLPFGLCTSPFFFDPFAKAVHYIFIYILDWPIVLHYLDDSFTILSPGADPGPYKAQFKLICDLLGLRQNVKKEGSGTTLNFLGIETGSTAMEVRLPEDKLAKATKLVAAALSSHSLLRHELEQLIGFQAFCAKVVVPGMSFLTSLHRALGRRTYFFHINSALRADLLW